MPSVHNGAHQIQSNHKLFEMYFCSYRLCRVTLNFINTHHDSTKVFNTDDDASKILIQTVEKKNNNAKNT